MAQKSLTPLVLPADPAAAYEAATKQYVDTKLALTPNTTIQTGNYVASANEFVSFDCTTGSRNFTLPNAPANGTLCGARIQLLGTAGNSVSILCAGSDVLHKPGGPVSMLTALTTGNHSILFEYQGGVWFQIASGFALANLNTVYQPLVTLTTKGDLFVATGSATSVRQGVGANGATLYADSGQTDGWTTGPAPLVFASTTARDALLTAPVAGQTCVTTDTGTFWQYITSAWYKPWSVLARVNGTANVQGASATVTIITSGSLAIPANRSIRISYSGYGQINGTTGVLAFIELVRDTTIINSYQVYCPTASQAFPYSFTFHDTPTAASHTYLLRLGASISNVGFDIASSTITRQFTVADAGAV